MMKIGEAANRLGRAAVPSPDEVEWGVFRSGWGTRFAEAEDSLAAAPE